MTCCSRSSSLGIEDRVAQDVGQDVDGERHVLLEHAGVVGGRLDAGRGVDLAADRFDLLGDLDRRAGLGALEGHVLEEMREAVLLLALGARAGADPDAEGGALELVHGMGDDAETGRKTRDANRHCSDLFAPRGCDRERNRSIGFALRWRR